MSIDPALLSIAQEVLSKANIQIGGTRPWDVKINNPAIYERIIRDGSLAIGEGYMDGWWDCEDLTGFFYRIFKHHLHKLKPNNISEVIKIVSEKLFNPQKQTIPIRISDIIKILHIKFCNLQTKALAQKNAELHYNLGNDLFGRMLGPYMQYSCGYWKNATTLDEAEEDKLRLICEKLQLEQGMRVLDMGCGWGGLAKYMAEKYGVSVVGVTVASEQQKFGEKFCKGLDVQILLKDYRDVEGQFDRIVTVEMIEHIGPKNYATFFSVVDRCLVQDGLFLLQTFGANEDLGRDEWMQKYIFPNSYIPMLSQIATASEPYFVVEDVHNIGNDCAKTYTAWQERFEDAWPDISQNYDERFKRMYSLLNSIMIGSFSARRTQIWQFVFSRGREGGVIVPR